MFKTGIWLSKITFMDKLGIFLWLLVKSCRQFLFFLFTNERSKQCIFCALCHCEWNKYHLELIDQVLTERVLPTSLDLPVPCVVGGIFELYQSSAKCLKALVTNTYAGCLCLWFRWRFLRVGGKVCVWHVFWFICPFLQKFIHRTVCRTLLQNVFNAYYCPITPPNRC